MIFPSPAPMQKTWHLVPFSVALVRKTRSFQTVGEDQPSPGTAVRQATLEVALQSTGTPVSRAIAWPLGPRKRGQFSAIELLLSTERQETHNARRARIAKMVRRCMGPEV